MIPKETLIAQLTFYTTGRKQAIEVFKKAEADLNAFNGAIEVLENLIELDGALDKTKESSEAKVVEVEPKK